MLFIAAVGSICTYHDGNFERAKMQILTTLAKMVKSVLVDCFLILKALSLLAKPAENQH